MQLKIVIKTNKVNKREIIIIIIITVQMNCSNRTKLSNDDGGNEFFHIQKHSGIYHTFMNESVWNMNNIQEMKWGWNCNWIDAWMVSTRISYGCEKKLSKIPSLQQLLKAFSFSIFIPSSFATECSMSWMFQGKKCLTCGWNEKKFISYP